MTIIAERGLVVRLPVQSGKFETASAEALADALDAATRESATRADLMEVRGDLKADIADGRAELTATRNELKVELGALRADSKAEAAALRTEMKAEIATLRSEIKLEIAGLRTEIAELRKDMQAQSDKLVIKLGSLIVVLFGLAFAAMRLL